MKAKESQFKKELFLVGVKVGRCTNSDMSLRLVRAVVPIFVATENYEPAAKSAVSKLLSWGFEFLDAQHLTKQFAHQQWSIYVCHKWPE